ncbi:hypothetical protein PRUPE_2G074200 [Prunus persica]|uniref:Uncharacterized protein n=1 Tax=Prunus persica TaxID=3760 RepID=A0A251QCL6_PRUPE|nr:hypothetical protein PRUPE_2G074200 [Prunus persica]
MLMMKRIEKKTDADGGRRVRDLQDSGDESDKEIYESDNHAATSRLTPLTPTHPFIKFCESKTNWGARSMNPRPTLNMQMRGASSYWSEH